MVHPCSAAAQKSRLTDVSFWPKAALREGLLWVESRLPFLSYQRSLVGISIHSRALYLLLALTHLELYVQPPSRRRYSYLIVNVAVALAEPGVIGAAL